MLEYKTNKIRFDVTTATLDKLITIFFSKNEHIRPIIKEQIISFIDILEPPVMDQNLNMRYIMLRGIISKYNKYKTRDFDEYVNIFSESKHAKEAADLFYELKSEDLTEGDVRFVQSYVVQRLKFMFLYTENHKMLQLTNTFEARSFNNLDDMIEIYQDSISKMHSGFKDIRSHNSRINRISINNKTLPGIMALARASLASPSSTVRTGIKHINKLLNGGFKSKRLYAFLSVPGGWKSGMLLHTVLWASKCNDQLKTKDPNKVPVVLYVSLENDNDETLERMYNHTNKKNIIDTDINEINHSMMKEFDFDKIGIELEYQPSDTISVKDIIALHEELVDEGKEVVMTVVDYTRRLLPTHSIDRSLSTYEGLGKITTELSNYAKLKDIPVITASQLNRDAVLIVDTMLAKGQVDIVSNLSSGHIGESKRILDDCDSIFAIYPEPHPTIKNQMYLGIKSLKKRDRKDLSVSPIAFLPYEHGNTMRLLEDVDLEREISIPTMKSLIATPIHDDPKVSNEINTVNQNLSAMMESSNLSKPNTII